MSKPRILDLFCGAGGCSIAMGIGWMTRENLSQAIPPVYTDYVGRALMAAISSRGYLLLEDKAE